MNRRVKYCWMIYFLLSIKTMPAQINNLKLTSDELPGSFPLIGRNSTMTFCYDNADAKVVGIAAAAFKQDIKAVGGNELSIVNELSALKNNVIIAGTIGQSKLIDELAANKLLDITVIKSKWESFTIQVIKDKSKLKGSTSLHQLAEVRGLLVIAGSDRRGTAFGIFHLSRLMGVSPFVWWADVAPAKRKQLFVSGSYTSPPPSVQYRGIFINDEDWGLQPWAAKHMDTAIRDIGPDTYARVFELMLRLKANYIWPAMHPCTKAFYYYKENPKMADEYAVIVGGSHCEPMLRNNVFEWAEHYEQEYGKKPGEWRYDINKDQIYTYWNDRIKEAVNYESVFTVGMRGVHDGSMPGPKNPDEKLKLLENVILDQREILKYNFEKPATEIPQIFVPYKEVLSLYRRGLPLADDITIIWPDDNHGYIRQLPNETERKRSGGHGVYYHLSYWGAPQDYLWLSSVSPSLIAYEMNKAWQYGARKLWVFNVGDIKPAEPEIQFAMDMAWDITKAHPAKAYEYTRLWAEETFGKKLAGQIADIKNEYYQLAASGKPEHMNNVSLSADRVKERLKRYESMGNKVRALSAGIPGELKDAYFQLIMYPVLGAMLMNEKILNAKSSFRNYPGNKLENEYLSDKSRRAFDSIRLITVLYNDRVSSGKWKGMMDWKPRNQAVFNMPATYGLVSAEKKDSVNPQTLTAQLIIHASSFTGRKETALTNIQVVPGLGIDGKGVTAFNKKGFPFSAFDSAYIEFDLPKLEAGNYTVIVKCLPGFDVDRSENLRYAIAINTENPTTINVHAEAESKEWKENVIRGYSAGKTTHAVSGSSNKLKIFFKDYNLVISTIEFYRN